MQPTDAGELPFLEAGAAPLLHAARSDGLLRATTDAASLSEADIVIVVIGTPVDEHLNPDPWAVRRAIASVAEHLRDGQLLVLRSTGDPGVTARVEELINEEGLAVDVESMARAQSGSLSADAVWAGFLDGMPFGLPQAGDKGLDHTRTWGRTYWGGALFCLIADIRIREQTDRQKTLRDALRGIVTAGYDITKSADIRAVLQIGDQATGVNVLLELYDEMRAAPLPKEIDSLWADLGVAQQAGRIIYDDDAPLADIRRALTQRYGHVL